MKKKIGIIALTFVMLFGSITALAGNIYFTNFRVNASASTRYGVGEYKDLGSAWENIAYVTITSTDKLSNETLQVRIRDNNSNYATNVVEVYGTGRYYPPYFSGKDRLSTLYYLWASCTSSYGYVTITGQWCP